MVDKIITRQELVDAQKDAQALEEVINGEPGELIKTRLGRLVYTLASVPQINTMTREEVTAAVAPKANKTYVDTVLAGFTNGASKFYATLAAANTDIANIGIKDKVEVGETANGGTWYKATVGATSLTKSPYDPLTQAKGYTDNLRTDVKDVVSKSGSRNKLFTFLDTSKRTIAYFDRDSELYLTRLGGSVQEEVLKLKDIVLSISDKVFDRGSRNKLLTFLDKNKKVIGYFDKNSELHLTGMTDSVQSKLSGDSLNTDRINNKILNVMSMSGIMQGKMLDLYSISRPIAPVPLEQMPLKYTVDNSIVNLRINQPVSNTVINTPYEREGEGRVVHPNIFQVKDSFCGYKYILGLTPYYMAIDKFENPVVYGSNDLINFDMLTELTLADVPVKSGNSTSQYNSDIFFAYDYHTGELLCGWREVKGGYGTALHARRTKDLKNWSAPEVLWQSSLTDMLLSPCIVYNPQTEMYDLFCIEAMSTSTNNPIRKVSTKYLQNPEWVDSHLIYPNIVGFTPWHVDVRYVGDKLMAIMHEYHADKGTLWVGISSDHGETWTWGEQSLLQGEYHKPYKASLCPIYISDTQIKLCYVWTSANFMADKSLGLMLYIQQSETIQISKI